jgi:hypothetical protein
MPSPGAHLLFYLITVQRQPENFTAQNHNASVLLISILIKFCGVSGDEYIYFQQQQQSCHIPLAGFVTLVTFRLSSALVPLVKLRCVRQAESRARFSLVNYSFFTMLLRLSYWLRWFDKLKKKVEVRGLGIVLFKHFYGRTEENHEKLLQ